MIKTGSRVFAYTDQAEANRFRNVFWNNSFNNPMLSCVFTT